MEGGHLSIETKAFDAPEVQDLLADWDQEILKTNPGFDVDGGSTVDAADFAGPRSCFLIAAIDGKPIGCGGIRGIDSTCAEVKRLYVRPDARQNGVGQALLRELESRAASLSYSALRLDTDGSLPALALFRSRGFSDVEPYNENAFALFWLEKQVRASP